MSQPTVRTYGLYGYTNTATSTIPASLPCLALLATDDARACRESLGALAGALAGPRPAAPQSPAAVRNNNLLETWTAELDGAWGNRLLARHPLGLSSWSPVGFLGASSPSLCSSALSNEARRALSRQR